MPGKFVYVLDANVIVRAVLLPRSLTRKAFDKALLDGEIVVSEAVVKKISTRTAAVRPACPPQFHVT